VATNIFRNISMKAGDAEKSYQWYRNQINNLGSRINGREILRTERLTSRLTFGNMYLFMYDPKHKETLPYYDTLPLVLPFNTAPNGFLGINLHYLPYLARFNLLGNLSMLATDENMNERTRINISWQILNSSSKYLSATACVKHYLTDHIKTRFLKINFSDWITAAMLPIESFRKEQKEKVWRETKRKIGNVN